MPERARKTSGERAQDSRGSRARAVFGGLFAVLASASLQATAQTVPLQVGPVTPVAASTDMGMPFVPPAAPSPRTRLFSGAVDLAEGYTSNASGQGTQTGKPDGFTRGRLDLGLHYLGARFLADAHYSLTGYYYDRSHDLDNLVNRFNLATTSALVPDHLLLNVRAFAAPATLTRTGALSANPDLVSGSNSRASYGYVAEPVLKFRLGDYAVSETTLSERALFFTQPFTSTTDSTIVDTTPPENSNSLSVTERVLSEPRFGRLRWGATVSYANMNQTTQSQRISEGSVDLAYAIDRAFAVLATTGYSQFESSRPLTQDPSGPIALGGFRLTYGPTFNLIAEAGVKNGFPTYLGSLNWSPTATFKIVASLTDSITVPQGNILNNLATLAASSEGVFSDSQSDYRLGPQRALFPQFATVSPVPVLDLALDNSIYRERRAQLAFIHQDQRTQYGLTIFGDMRDRLSVATDTTPGNTWLYGARIDATRKLRRNLTGHAGVSYSIASEFGGQDRILTADAGLTYNLSEKLDCYLTAQYLHRESNGQIVLDVPLSDFVAIVGVRRGF